MTPEDVVAEYQKWHNITETARRMNINYSVVRKCLVTHGLLEYPRTRLQSSWAFPHPGLTSTHHTSEA